MNSLSASRQKLLALAILAAIALGSWGLFIQPLRLAYQHADQQIIDLQDQHQRYQRINQSHDALRARLQQRQQQLDQAQVLLQGRTQALLSASLQQRLRDIIADSGGELVRVQAMEPVIEQHLTVIRLQVRLRANLDQLLTTLMQLQQSQPLLNLSQLSIQSRPARILRSSGRPISWPLEVQFQLSGYSLHQEAP